MSSTCRRKSFKRTLNSNTRNDSVSDRMACLPISTSGRRTPGGQNNIYKVDQKRARDLRRQYDGYILFRRRRSVFFRVMDPRLDLITMFRPITPKKTTRKTQRDRPKRPKKYSLKHILCYRHAIMLAEHTLPLTDRRSFNHGVFGLFVVRQDSQDYLNLSQNTSISYCK